MRIGVALLFLAFMVPVAGCSREAGGQPPLEPAGTRLSNAAMPATVPSEAIYNPCPASVTTCLIMPLGDSLTQGAGDEANGGYRGELFRLLQRTGRAFDFVGSTKDAIGSGHEGHPGAHISLLDSYAGIWLPAFKPHVILMMMGTNDLDIHLATHVANYVKNLDRMFTLLPDSLIVVAAIPQVGSNDSVAIDFNRQLAAMVRSRAAAGKHVAIVDMHSAVQRRDVSPDKTHLIHSGYVKLAASWYSVLDRFMSKRP
jgi:lysophospholipase L1-like esterase